MSEKLTIRLELDEELAQKFETVKNEKGIENNTDVLRSLITEAYKKIQREASSSAKQ
jgi:adenylate kinase